MDGFGGGKGFFSPERLSSSHFSRAQGHSQTQDDVIGVFLDREFETYSDLMCFVFQTFQGLGSFTFSQKFPFLAPCLITPEILSLLGHQVPLDQKYHPFR